MAIEEADTCKACNSKAESVRWEKLFWILKSKRNFSGTHMLVRNGYLKKKIRSGKKKGWKYNTSGILVHSVNLKWDDSFFVIFPLIGLEKGKEGEKQRHDMEIGIGNYLILNDVPIIDYYSHRI